jgi:hypothetical protein
MGTARRASHRHHVPPGRTRRIGLSLRNILISKAQTLTHSLHIKSAADCPQGAASSACEERTESGLWYKADSRRSIHQVLATASALPAPNSAARLLMVSGARNRRADTRRRPSRRRREFPFGNSSRGSPAALRSLIRIRRDFIPKWTKRASSLILPKMTKRLLVVLDRSLFDRFGESERRLAPRISYRAVGGEPLFKHAH